MRKAVIIVFIGFVLGFVVLKLVSKDDPSKFSVSQSSTANPNSIIIPVNQNNKDTIFFGLAYTFGGKVKQFEGSGTSYKISLANNVPSMPVFTTDDKTAVVRRINKVDTASNFSEIKIGGTVVLAALYDYRKKTWKVTKIFLI
jgi:hypothetical protein